MRVSYITLLGGVRVNDPPSLAADRAGIRDEAIEYLDHQRGVSTSRPNATDVARNRLVEVLTLKDQGIVVAIQTLFCTAG